MKNKWFSALAAFICAVINAQTTYVGANALVTISPNTLVYNGGGFKAAGSGVVNNSGNVMVVGSGPDKFETTAASNFVLTFTDATNYGQLYISGLAQGNITGKITKNYLPALQGSYQQVGIPFYNKTLADLGTDLGVTFSTKRYSQDEILRYDDAYVVARNTAPTDTFISGAYYMVGTKTLQTVNPPVAGFALKGIPIAEGVTKSLTGAASQYPSGFGTGGYGRNIYNEYFNSYLQDSWDVGKQWTDNYGKNIYQYSNPYLTNLDLSYIYNNEANGDDNFISNIQGIRVAPGTVITNSNGTYATTPSYVTFGSGTPTGDISGLLIRPLQTFVVKLNGNTGSPSLNFNKLRLFSNTRRLTSPYSVTASKMAKAENTVKQLGITAFDKDGNVMGSTYFVVYKNGVSGPNPAVSTQVQNNSDNVIGTFEEDATKGGFDMSVISKYWLNINEVNETNFKGKAVPMVLYSPDVATLKFEIRENAELLQDNESLSTGINFYYQPDEGKLEKITQNLTIPVTTNSYSLYYGNTEDVLATSPEVKAPSRTQIYFNPNQNNYAIRFDPNWKKATIQVFDMSGKLVITQKDVQTANDFIIDLPVQQMPYIVTAISEKGEKATAKIIR